MEHNRRSLVTEVAQDLNTKVERQIFLGRGEGLKWSSLLPSSQKTAMMKATPKFGSVTRTEMKGICQWGHLFP